MKLTVTRAMLQALEQATDKPDWLAQRLAALRAAPDPCVLSLGTQESTALEELCAMNIRFDAAGKVLAQHQPLDDLATLIMQNY